MSFWYDSTKPKEAIQLSDDLQMPILIFIKDDSPISNQMEEIFDSGKANHVIEGKYIALKLTHNTKEFKELSEAVTIPKVPSISIFIERNIRALIDEVNQGAPKLIEDLSTALNMIKRIDQGEDISSLQASMEGSSNTLNLKPLTAEEKEKKKEELKIKLEQRRVERLAKEKEEEKAREASRRNMGKEISSAKKDLQDKEAKLILDNKIREKKEEQEARRRIKEQIAQDKAERAAQRLKSKAAISQQQALEADSNTAAPKPGSSSASTPTVSKLSIRLLDGSVHRAEFKPDDTLKTVIDHIANNFISGQNFQLSLSYPMKLFTKDDENSTLLSLGLCPSNSLVVKKA
ncbi:UBX-domain-containing protein [Neoconidiobolus thromboides FSU 785]|nr:UBX-domain-containing protein [Neoconidiobolus thromboides FSU 785]